MPIEQAPYRVQREHMRRERLFSAIAALVLTSVITVVVYVVYRLVR